MARSPYVARLRSAVGDDLLVLPAVTVLVFYEGRITRRGDVSGERELDPVRFVDRHETATLELADWLDEVLKAVL